MGEIADDMMDGTMCQCGVINDDLLAHMQKHAPGGGRVDVPWEPPGFPWTCPDCRREHANARSNRRSPKVHT